MLVAVSMFRDERDMAEPVIRHLLGEGVDHVIVADNLSTDGTRRILNVLARELPLTIVDDLEPGYWQARKMTRLAHMAGEMGAEWVIPFDADEILYSPDGRLCDVLPDAAEDIQMVVAWEHIPQPEDGAAECNSVLRIRHRRPQPKQFMKVVFRYHPTVEVWQGNHYVDHPGAERRGFGLLEMREFQYRTLEQTARKVRNGKAAYDATTMPVTEGSHWRQMGSWSDHELELWWKDYCSQPVVLDPAPVRS